MITKIQKIYGSKSKTNKMVYFGQLNPPYEDYTKHHDEKRRELFRKRNHKWATAEKYSSAYTRGPGVERENAGYLCL